MIKTLINRFKSKWTAPAKLENENYTYGFSCAPDVTVTYEEARNIKEGAVYLNSVKYEINDDPGRFEFVGHEHAGKDKPIIYVLRHMRTGVSIRVEADLFSQIFKQSKR